MSINQSPQDIILKFEEKEYVLTNHFKETIINVYDEIKDETANKKLRVIKTIIGCKFNLKSTIYKEDKLMNKIIGSIFDDNVLKVLIETNEKPTGKTKIHHNTKYHITRDVI